MNKVVACRVIRCDWSKSCSLSLPYKKNFHLSLTLRILVRVCDSLELSEDPVLLPHTQASARLRHSLSLFVLPRKPKAARLGAKVLMTYC